MDRAKSAPVVAGAACDPAVPVATRASYNLVSGLGMKVYSVIVQTMPSLSMFPETSA